MMNTIQYNTIQCYSVHDVIVIHITCRMENGPDFSVCMWLTDCEKRGGKNISHMELK